MNKILLPALATALVLGFSACSDDSKDEITVSRVVKAYNLFTSLDGTETPRTGVANYTYSTKYPDNLISFSVNSMPMPGGATASFGTIEMPFTISNASAGNRSGDVWNFSSETPWSTGDKLTNLKGILTQAVYLPGDVEIAGYEFAWPAATEQMLFMEYDLNSYWHVRTFWTDMTYAGTTTTTYPGMEAPFSSSEISYRVVMKSDANGLTGKADVIFYKAKFAPPAPEITVVLRNLDLAFTNGGFTVSGTDVIPDMVESGALQANPSYTFNKFSLTASGNLTTAVAEYQVASRFNGSFQGSCIAK